MTDSNSKPAPGQPAKDCCTPKPDADRAEAPPAAAAPKPPKRRGSGCCCG